MAPQDIIWAFSDAIPLIRRGWRWLLERNMEVRVKAHFEDMGDPYGVIAPNLETGRLGGVYALLDLRLVNHRTDRPERIIECWAELRKRRLFLWRRTLAKIPVLTYSPNSRNPLDSPIKDIYLEPMGKPKTHVISIAGNFQDIEMPRRSELVLVFRMVGPMRKYIYKLTDVRHNPKQAADEEGRQP